MTDPMWDPEAVAAAADQMVGALPPPPGARFFDTEAAETAVEPFALLSWDELMAQPDPEWLVDGILPAGGFGAIIGPPKHGKSFLVIDLLLCIAAGIPFHGHEVRQGVIIYAAGEGRGGIKWRCQAWLAEHPEVDEEELRRNFRVLPRAPRLLDEKEAAQLRATCRRTDDLAVFVIDTWARGFLGGDENSAQDTGRAIALVEAIKEETGATGAVVHHTNADGTKARGSTALLGAVDFEISCRKDELGNVEVKNTAMKDASPFETKTFEMVPTGHSLVLRQVDLRAMGGQVSGYSSWSGQPSPWGTPDWGDR